MRAGRVRRILAAAAALVVGASVATLVPGGSAAADVAQVDYSCDTPPVSIAGIIPDPILLEDLDIELVDRPDPVVQGQPLSYDVQLPVPDLTGGLDLPATYEIPPFGSVPIAPYGKFYVNSIVLTVPIPTGLDVPSASAVSFDPVVPWLTVTKSASNLVFRIESPVSGSGPTGRAPMEIDLDAAEPELRVLTASGWVSVLPLPDVTIVGTATGAPSSTIDLKPPSLTLNVRYSKTVLGFVNVVSWNNVDVPCVPLEPNQTITSTAVVAPAPGLSVTKALADGDDEVVVGETIDYTVTVSNSGNVPLTGVTLSDPNATCEAVVTSLTVGASDEVACTHVTGVEDLGTYSNTATADSIETSPVASNTVDTLVVDPPCTQQFSDVSPSHPFFDEICWMVRAGVTNGYQDGTFKPGGNVSRAAMAAFLQRLSGETIPGDCTQQFSDVSPSHPFFEEICWMVRAGVTNGYQDGTFRPGGKVSRAAMAAFLQRLVDVPVPGDCTQQFSDVSPSHPFFGEICWMVRAGVTNGYQDGTFRPGGNVSRAAMAAFLFRLSVTA